MDKDKKSHLISVRLTSTATEKIDHYRKALKWTRSQFVEDCILAILKIIPEDQSLETPEVVELVRAALKVQKEREK